MNSYLAYVNEGLEFGQYFFTDIVTEGVVLYNTETLHFAQARELTNEELMEIAKRYFDSWYFQANEFTAGSEFYAHRKNFKTSAFELHQAAESIYYTVLLVFTGYKPKTHSLLKLRKLSKQISEELYLVFPIEANKEDKRLFDLLKKGYIHARYKTTYRA